MRNLPCPTKCEFCGYFDWSAERPYVQDTTITGGGNDELVHDSKCWCEHCVFERSLARGFVVESI